MLPGLSGTEVCRAAAAAARSVPIIMVTAKDAEVDKVVGLELGADDYVTKPYSLARAGRPDPGRAAPRAASREELGRRRRSRPARCGWTSSGTSSPSTASTVALPLKEFELLELLLRNAGRVLTRGQLIDRVWGADYVGDTKTLDVHVKRLRAKIEPDPANPKYLRDRARPRLQVRGQLPSSSSIFWDRVLLLLGPVVAAARSWTGSGAAAAAPGRARGMRCDQAAVEPLLGQPASSA